MAQATGANSKLVMGFQADVDTIATAGFVIPINSSNIKGTRNQNTAATIRGNLNPVEPFDGNTAVAGSVVVPIDSIAFWYFLRALLGAPTTTGASSPWTHTFKAGTTREYLTFEQQFTDLGTAKYFQYTGCKVNSMSLSAGDDGELVATFEVVGAAETIASAPFDVSPTALSFSRLKNNQLSMTEGGSAISNAKLVDLNINFNCDTSQYVIGAGGVLGSIPDGVMSVSGNLTTLFEDTALLEKAVNSTESAIVLTFSAGASSSLEINFPEIKYSLNSPGIEGPQGIVVSLPFGAYYNDATEATSVEVVLTNTEEHA